MKKRILILTQQGDTHSYAVARVLQSKGHTPLLWHTSDFPAIATESVSFREGQPSISVNGPELFLEEDDFDVVWNRRPAYFIDEEVLHPSDLEFAELGCRLFRKSLFDILARGAFWVNPHESVRKLTKLLQHSEAVDIGFETPDTLFTNDPTEIREFVRSCESGVVYKPMSTLPWKAESGYFMPFTSRLTKADLVEDDVLKSTPGIYQECVPKSHELRVTVMGNSVFTARLLSQRTEKGRLDWRKAYDELEMASDDLPDELKGMCFKLLERLGFVFGCFDFVVTPEGRYVFLEVNQMGQFLFVERYCELPLLDAFTDFLIEGKPDFQWCRRGPRVRYADLEEEVRKMVVDLRAQHRAPPPQFWAE